MSTDTDTNTRLGGQFKQIATKVATFVRYAAPVALFATFAVGYSLAIVVATEALPTSFFTEIGRLAEIAIQTTLGVPVVVSMVLAARYAMMLAGETIYDSWEEATAFAAGGCWLLFPPLLAVWPSLGGF